MECPSLLAITLLAVLGIENVKGASSGKFDSFAMQSTRINSIRVEKQEIILYLAICCLRLELELFGTCTGTYDNTTSSYITSPNYPRNYGDGIDCSWTITTCEEITVVLHFTDFFTEYFDKLYVYEGTNDKGHQLGKFSGRRSVSPIRSNERSLYLRFVSNSYTNEKGFMILLRTYGKQLNKLILDAHIFKLVHLLTIKTSISNMRLYYRTWSL